MRSERRGILSPTVKFWVGVAIVLAIVAARGLRLKAGKDSRNIDPTGIVVEPSGLTVHPERGTLVVVGDEGQVVELTTEGHLVTERNLGGDFEGITADPHRRRLYAIDEKKVELAVLDWDTFERVGTVPLRPILREAGLPDNGKDSFEGIAYQRVESPTNAEILWLAHQYGPAAILKLELSGNPPSLSLAGHWEVDLQEISALCIDPRTNDLFALGDSDNVMVRLSPEGKIFEVVPLGEGEQEGIAILPNGDFIIADDLGGVFRYPVSSGQTNRPVP